MYPDERMTKLYDKYDMEYHKKPVVKLAVSWQARVKSIPCANDHGWRHHVSLVSGNNLLQAIGVAYINLFTLYPTSEYLNQTMEYIEIES